MQMILPMLGQMMGGGAAAGAAAGGSTLMSMLQGGATLLSIVSGLDAADEEAESLGLAAFDAEEEADIEALSGIQRRTSLKRDAHNYVGETALAFAAGGQDLTFGSPVQARKEAFRDLDAALSSDNLTQTTRVSRLKERAGEYRRKAGAVRRGAGFKAVAKGLEFGAGLYKRG